MSAFRATYEDIISINRIYIRVEYVYVFCPWFASFISGQPDSLISSVCIEYEISIRVAVSSTLTTSISPSLLPNHVDQKGQRRGLTSSTLTVTDMKKALSYEKLK
ncbi:unnamed protein product [Lasius platythorax]|uniref:Uncharacterized protein n=1 Tax=Lasius platythorax TaxID=488582 RepID=A0AAV2NII5_9HYME